MRIAIALIALLGPAAFPASAQAPSLGQVQVQVFQAIPKTKVAVQLTTDSSLSRSLRREVMIRLSQRGNEVGFSGGNVMRMDVAYLDLSGGSGVGPQSDYQPSYQSPGSNPLPQMYGQLPGLRGDASPSLASTLRVSLTLYSVSNGKVLWYASSSCVVESGKALSTGQAMIDNIFDDADKTHIGDAGCPF